MRKAVRFAVGIVPALLTVTFIAAGPASAAAPGAPAAPVASRSVHSSVVASPIVSAMARRKSVGLSPNATPSTPCTMSGNLSMNWVYVNHVLETTSASMVSDVTCSGTAPGATMQHLSIVANLYHNTKFVTTGSIQTSCTYNGRTPCNHATGDGEHGCPGAGCAGVWQQQAVDRMDLPAGWVWVSWGSDCTPLNQNTSLLCQSWTGTITVPATN